MAEEKIKKEIKSAKSSKMADPAALPLMKRRSK